MSIGWLRAALFDRTFVRQVGIVTIVALLASAVPADDWPQWRGPNRDGISKETGLQKEWPKDGPKLVWHVKDVGEGYSTPAVVGSRFYVVTNHGMDDELVQAREVKDGSIAWSTRIGKVGKPGQQPNYAAARSTPTVVGKYLYALGSDGDLACLEIASGKVRWQKNLLSDFGGKSGLWAYSESPLVDGDRLICTPGGADSTLLALNKDTGEVIWKCSLPEEDEAAYASVISVNAAGAKQYVQLLQKGLVGIDAKSGKFLWRFAKPVSRFNANIPTPVAGDGFVYAGSAGTGGGAVKLSSKDGGVESEEVYFDAKMPTAIGGAVKIGNALYGTTAQAMLCIEFNSGKVLWQERALGAASMCAADGRLYLHSENGDVALVEPSTEAYREKGKFTPPDQPKHVGPMSKAWSYPVVANGRLYIRDLDTMWCYDVSE